MSIESGMFIGKSFDSVKELISFGNGYDLFMNDDLEKISRIDELGCFNLNKFEHLCVVRAIEKHLVDTHYVIGASVVVPAKGCAIKDVVDDMYWSAQYWSYALKDVFWEDIQTIICSFEMN